jgi:ABC-type transporter Mla subunit MlaD
MEPNPIRSAPSEAPIEEGFGPVIERQARTDADAEPGFEPMAAPGFDAAEWHETRAEHDGAGGRMVLGWALAVLAALWIAYTGWSAGRALGGVPLSSPALAQWIAVVTGPLALMGLIWLMFGRTRRKEAEKFTRSVITMRAEAQSLEALLAVLATRIGESHQALHAMSGQLMGLGEEAAQRLGSVTRELDAGSERLSAHGAALDRAAEAARTDIGVLLADLPIAEARAVSMAERLRETGGEASRQAALFEDRVGSLTERTREADTVVGEAAGRLVTHLTHIESASAAAHVQLDEVSAAHRSEINGLLGHAATALDNIRSGIDAQAAAVAALLAQSTAGLGRAGQDSAEALGARLTSAGSALDGLSTRIAEQERASQRLVAELDVGLAGLDERFLQLAQSGDHRATAMLGALGRLRGEMTSLGEQAGGHDQLVEQLAVRTDGLRRGVDALSADIREVLSDALRDAEDSASRLTEQVEVAKPAIDAVRDAAVEASDRLASGVGAVEAQHDRLAELLAAVDTGIGGAERRLSELGQAIGTAAGDAERLSNETGPALVAAMLQVREAAAHAAERAREAIAGVIPESAVNLSAAARTALEAAVQATVAEQLRDVERVAVRAVEAAREASERLTRQMLTIGQSASALEAHIERTHESQRQHDSDEFAKRVALLIDSMHSASIDVGKILADEVDDKNWTAYLKGNRGVFTRRAARLLGGGETRAISQHYQADAEFAGSVNRYVADFEAMLRRVLAERDGGMMAVTLMSSDVGKLYAALATAVDKQR